MNLIQGYLGLFKQPLNNPKLNATFYCITDELKEKLYVIMLTPEAYNDIYSICKNITYKEIYLIPVSIDIMFISSLFNLITALAPIKSKIAWIYPDDLQMKSSILFEFKHYKTLKFIDEGYDLQIEFALSNEKDRPFYDIYITAQGKTICFCQYVTEDKMNDLYDDISINEIHMAYRSTIYGGLTYPEILRIHNKYHNKIKVHSLTSVEDYAYCTEMNRVPVGKVVYYDFI